MRYNELTYHKASPFYKQGYMPDIAWLNRKPKQFPSEIPTGQDHFTQVGRRHYNARFNHSEIEATGVLTSPEKYPYQNRIAHEKTYMRNLDTTDIEGAGSGTRVNEAVRYKLRAQEELARRYNQSLDMKEHKEHEYEQKRRELAIKNYQKIQERKLRVNTNGQSLENSRLSQNPEQDKSYNQNYNQIPVEQMQQTRNARADNREGQKYITLLPKSYYNNLERPPREPQYVNKYIQPNEVQARQPQQAQQYPSQQINYQTEDLRKQISNSTRQDANPTFNANDRHKSNPSYVGNYDTEYQRRRQDYARTIEIDQMARQKLQDKKEFRKHNPTNLSFTGQSIVSGKH